MRARGDLPDQDPGREFADREVKLATTIGGAGVVHGDLTAECAAAVAAVLDALSAPAGKKMTGPRASGTTTRWPRRCGGWPRPGCCRSGPGSRSRPGRTSPWPTCSCSTADSALQDQWTEQVRARWAARRAHAAETGASDGAWLDGDAAEAIACDAAMAPIVTGDINVDALDDLVRLCVELDAQRRDGVRDAARAALEQAVIGKAVDLLSGPGGLASFLRRRQLGARLGGPSLPLDIGYAETVPAGIRERGAAAGPALPVGRGCTQPAGACEVHHTTHKARGGKTSVKDCVLLCPFHHQVVIHRWGWTLVVNPDGTTTAWNKNKTKVLHSHGPPARAG